MPVCTVPCRAFPDAFTVRCFAFEPSDEQIAEDRKRAGNFIMFPPGKLLIAAYVLTHNGHSRLCGASERCHFASNLLPAGDWEQLDNHAEVVMHDFAACLLAELERWMLNASPAMVDLATLASDGCLGEGMLPLGLRFE